MTPNPRLAPLDKGPYYAVPIHAGVLGTAGGLRTDGHGRVLDHQDAPLPGLYAAGTARRPSSTTRTRAAAPPSAPRSPGVSPSASTWPRSPDDVVQGPPRDGGPIVPLFSRLSAHVRTTVVATPRARPAPAGRSRSLP
ncbi:FAD-binding protein [Streptomyces sp. KL116D]|uniref:FAD-binding protein n=1 Tax=Streptomyces sp. KL116D TaxID=3045152 RepID=UPI0035570B59